MKANDLSALIEKRANEYRNAGNEEYYEKLRAVSAIIFFEGDKPEREELRRTVEKMDSWVPMCLPQVVIDDNDWMSKKDLLSIPFMTEAFLYPLLGKEDARTLLAIWGSAKIAIIELEDKIQQPQNKYYVLLRSPNPFVKEAKYFESQGGLVDDWGEGWKSISATSIGDARQKAWEMLRDLREEENDGTPPPDSVTTTETEE